jgi:hypothetical protein
MRCAVALVVAFTYLPTFADGQIGKEVSEAVVQIVTPPVRKDPNTGQLNPLTGTGLIVGKLLPEGSQPRIAYVLITNKHMIGDWNPVEGKVLPIYDWLVIKLYKKAPDASGPVTDVRVPLKGSTGTQDIKRLALHPDEQVDLAAVRFDMDIPKDAGPAITSLDLGYLVPFDQVRSIPVGLGDMVFALGYPAGITSLDTNRPVAKVGHLAATPGEQLAIRSLWKTRAGKDVAATVRGKLFLIDGLIVGGNSGGPVMLPAGPILGFDPVSKQSVIRTTQQNRILGIVSSGWAQSGLVFAYSGDYVKPLMESLFPSP